jgi:hypothetical protein
VSAGSPYLFWRAKLAKIPAMATLAITFVAVRWLWILKWSIILSCLNISVHRWSGMKQPSLLADLGSNVVLAACWLVFLKLSHASAGAVEVVLTFFVAYAMEALIGGFLSKGGAVKIPSPGRTQR